MSMEWASAQAVRHYLQGNHFDTALLDVDGLSAVAWLSGYQLHHGTLPSEEHLAQQFSMTLDELQSYDAVQDLLRERYAQRQLQPLLDKVMDALQAGTKPSQVISMLVDGGMSVQNRMVETIRSTMLVAEFDQRWAHRAERTFSNYSPRIASFGFPQLDLLTNGVEKGDFIVLHGPWGGGKSTLKRRFISQWLKEGKRVLSIVLEETKEAEIAKLEAILAGVAAQPLLRYEMPPGHMLDMQSNLAYLKGQAGEVIVYESLSEKSWSTITSLIAKHRADICVVDQLTLLAKSRDWKDMAPLLSEGRQVAIQTVPIMMLTQSDATGDVKYVKAAVEDGSKILAVSKDPVLPTEQKYLELRKNRDGEVGAKIALDYRPGDSVIEELQDTVAPMYQEGGEAPSFETAQTVQW